MSGIGGAGITPGTGTGQIALTAGAVTVGTNNDKTGYSLTAGSYSVRASSTQSGTIFVSSALTATATVSSVTTTRADLGFLGFLTNSSTLRNLFLHLVLTNATTVTATKETSTDFSTGSFRLMEYF